VDPQSPGLQLDKPTVETTGVDTSGQAADKLANVANDALQAGADVADAASSDPL
jgi:hypothetical protein